MISLDHNPSALREHVPAYLRELAALVGVSSDTIINWELRGVRPMGERLRRLQEALEIIVSGVGGP